MLYEFIKIMFKKICLLLGTDVDRYIFYTYEKIRYYKHVGKKIDLKNPKTFSEKIVWKKLYDRNPLLPLTQDKHLLREYILDCLGMEKGEKILVPLYHITDDPTTIPFNQLEKNYIIKPSHSSGQFIVVREEKPNIDYIIGECKKWLNKPYGLDDNEWAYFCLQRKVIVEKLLLTDDNTLPDDYKFFMFHGKCRLILNCSNRKGLGGLAIDAYTPEWEYIDIKYNGRIHALHKRKKPEKLHEMVEIAEKLVVPFDFVRVDFYYLNKQIYLGELTHYPSSGRIKFDPIIFDYTLGQYWNLALDKIRE